MTPGNTFTSKLNSNRRSKRALRDSNAYMADYERQRRYYFREEDDTGYRYEEQQFESIFLLQNPNMYSNFIATPPDL